RLEEVGLERRKLSGAEERVGVGEKGLQDLAVSLLVHVDVPESVDQCPGETRRIAGEHGEARSRDLDGALEVEDAVRRTQVPVGLRFEIETARLPTRAPPP